jgi:predicted  nucleic acid-binding Zn-ribbon protein
VIPVLQSLIALQGLDTAADAIRRRLNDMPGAEREIEARIDAARAEVESARARLADNQHARRDLEKQVAQVDTRLTRFDDHKAAVKTNQEFTALLHEIATAKAEKDALEEQILLLLEAADAISADVRAAEARVAEVTREGAAARAALDAEQAAGRGTLEGLTADRTRAMADVPAPVLAKYEQLLKMRRYVAVAAIEGEMCTACHVRLRPAVALHIRRNDDIIQCDSCQRILYAVAKEPAQQ